MKRFWRSWVSIGAVGLAAQEATLPPPGFGSLRQDQVGVRLGDSRLSVRVLPLDERVTRLLAPDAWRSLRDMKASKSEDIAIAARQAGRDSLAAFMVTLFALQPDVRFNPDALIITSQGVAYRPLHIVPFTPRFTEGTLSQRQQAAAIYLFDPAIDVLQPMSVTWVDQTSDAWSEALRALNTERSRVLTRAAQQAQP